VIDLAIARRELEAREWIFERANADGSYAQFVEDKDDSDSRRVEIFSDVVLLVKPLGEYGGEGRLVVRQFNNLDNLIRNL
jgi:hypothetical protein